MAPRVLSNAPDSSLSYITSPDDYKGLPYLQSPTKGISDQRASQLGLGPEETKRLNELLASPIVLDQAHLEQVVMSSSANRGSAVVMSEQLDALERRECPAGNEEGGTDKQ